MEFLLYPMYANEILNLFAGQIDKTHQAGVSTKQSRETKDKILFMYRLKQLMQQIRISMTKNSKLY